MRERKVELNNLDIVKVAILSFFTFFAFGFFADLFLAAIFDEDLILGSRELSAISLLFSLALSCLIIFGRSYNRFQSALSFNAVGFSAVALGGVSSLLIVVSLIIMQRKMGVLHCSSNSLNTFAIFSALLLAPVAEELFFRGILFNAFRGVAVLQTFVSIVVTSILFSLAHYGYNFETGVVYFLLGVYFCLLRIKFSSVVPAIIAHIVINLVLIAYLNGLFGCFDIFY
ncbi:CPBP family intramembrane glutamic endopeptidase [Rheinheimera aquimaris]|uniref:CPBP family intramembrane glutamic endopeptidase n=1 Tax=Rheinheimera aquimaris TaxID=412437 RepID=UPI003A97A3AF